MKSTMICHSLARLCVLKFLRSFRNRRQITHGPEKKENYSKELHSTVIFSSFSVYFLAVRCMQTSLDTVYIAVE